MKTKHTILAFILLASSYTLFAQQSADAIINDYFNAIGGRDKIAQLKSVYMEGTFEVMGNTGQINITVLNGKATKSVTKFNGTDIIQVITDTSGWMINPLMGSPDPAPIPKEQYTPVKDEIYIGGALFNYKNSLQIK